MLFGHVFLASESRLKNSLNVKFPRPQTRITENRTLEYRV